jgi:hypothetical protein
MPGAWIEDTWMGKDATEESEANNQLCAAAPRMHELIQQAVACYENSICTDAGMYPVIADMKDLLEGLETRP